VDVKILGLRDVNVQKHRGLVPSGPIELFSMITLTRTASCHPSKAEQLALQSQAQGSTFLNLLGQEFTDVKKHGLNTIISQAVKVEPFPGAHDSLSSEYPWKDSVMFRFPLPENILTLDTVEDYQTFLKSPPNLVKISVFERTFFSDNKLGELFLPLSTICSETAFKEWLPLSQRDKAPKSSSWFMNIQATLKFSLMSLSELHSLTLHGSPPGSNLSESPGIETIKSKNFGDSLKYLGSSLSQNSLAASVRQRLATSSSKVSQSNDDKIEPNNPKVNVSISSNDLLSSTHDDITVERSLADSTPTKFSDNIYSSGTSKSGRFSDVDDHF
jgi:hypothetical protein